MPNKTLVRCLAVLFCLSVLVLSVPSLGSAAKATNKVSFFQVLKQPALLLAAFVPAVHPAFQAADSITSKAAGKASPRVRPTTDIPIPRPGTGD